MRLLELKALVDEAVAQTAKHKIDPQVGFYFFDPSGDHRLMHVEIAEIGSLGNINNHSIGLLIDHEMSLECGFSSTPVFLLSDDKQSEVFN